MRETPTPVVMLSRYTEEGTETTMEALEAGAVDFFHKPGEDPSIDLQEYKAELVETVERAAKVRPEPLAPTEPAPADPDAVAPTTEPRTGEAPVVIIASSTGGPRLLKEQLRDLPREARFRVIVVQHLRADFTSQFADDLDSVTAYTVRETEDGGTVGPGEIVVAHGGAHLEVTGDDGTDLTLRHVGGDDDLTVQPAADVAMRTAAEHVDGRLVGVVMTGLGSDGTAGVEAIKRAGGRTLAQDEASSPAHWMPTSARQSGHVDRVFAAEDLVGALLETADPARGQR
jgi:two-component system chemotaxis response regulator CheB